jgi:hypothetical protein
VRAQAALETLRHRDATNPASFAPAIMLKSDPTLLQLVAAWPNAPRGMFDGEADASPVPLDARTRWLWALVEPDPIPGWITTAGLPDAPHVRRTCWVAIDNVLVLPDGTLSTWADRYVRQFVFTMLGGAPT